MTPLRIIMVGALALAGCTPAVPPPGDGTLAAALATAAPEPAPGECWHAEVLPALFETVTEQVVVPAANGAPASVRTETHQRMVRPRREVWFRVVCPAQGAGTPDFTATLQRALKARGVYAAPVTGVMDGETRAAIRRWQAARGLDSDEMSLEGARVLGIVPGGFK